MSIPTDMTGVTDCQIPDFIKGKNKNRRHELKYVYDMFDYIASECDINFDETNTGLADAEDAKQLLGEAITFSMLPFSIQRDSESMNILITQPILVWPHESTTEIKLPKYTSSMLLTSNVVWRYTLSDVDDQWRESPQTASLSLLVDHNDLFNALKRTYPEVFASIPENPIENDGD